MYFIMSAQASLLPRESKSQENGLTDEFILQRDIVQQAMEQSRNLKEVLEENGISYSDLCYASNKNLKPRKPNFTLSTFVSQHKKIIPTVSFFSGAGGLDLGFNKANFKSKILIEHNSTFCETLRENFKKADVIGPPHDSGDISNTKIITNMLKERGIGSPYNGVFVGGPPCQPFSIAANQRFNKSGDNFKRTGFQHRTNGGLLFDFIEIILKFKPKVFLIENVPGLMDIDGGQQLQVAYKKLLAKGYFVHEPILLEASDYGIPQFRKRLFIIGSRVGKFKFEIPVQSRKQRSIDHIFDVDDNLNNHEIREHAASSINRYMVVEYGKRDELGRVDRLDPFKPSKTVIAGGLKGGGRSHLHPIVPRTLSPRECARLQTFPDTFKFTGSSARQFTQIGNAVPPLLAAQIAEYVIRPIFRR